MTSFDPTNTMMLQSTSHCLSFLWMCTYCIYLWTNRHPRTYVTFYISHYSEQDRRRTSPTRGKRFFSSLKRPDGLWSPSSFLFHA